MLHLHYNVEFDRFVLSNPSINTEDFSYEMVIEHHGLEEYTYRFLVWEDGDWSEIKTSAEMRQLRQDVEDNEGSEIANLWAAHQPNFVSFLATHRVFGLKAKWEAMMTLGLFTIPVSYKPWLRKPFSADAEVQFAAAREKWQREDYAL